MRGKIIVIEGTDCSGKETQSKRLIERLTNDGVKIKYLCFPRYDTPTGKIIGGPYLGKSEIGEGWFSEGAGNVNPIVASLYYAADRKYNVDEINNYINDGVNVVLDRYTYSNMGHQGGKLYNKEERIAMYKWLEKLEFDMLGLPIPDIKVLLYVPFEVSKELKKGRVNFDQHETNEDHLKNAEAAYLEVSELYGFKKIICNDGNSIRSIEDINEELYNYIKTQLYNNTGGR